jgi:UDPglucose 6-dehydrogenase
MKITIIGGGGYVGLITAVGFARLGHDVVAVDINEKAVASLSAGTSPIHEAGLDVALKAALADGKVRFTTSTDDGVPGAQLVFVTVGTPPHPDGSPDLSALRAVTADLSRTLDANTVVAIKSTVPVGSLGEMQSTFETHSFSGVELVANPEFLSEGSALRDFDHPSRIVVGATSERARALMRELYAPFIEGGEQLNPDMDISRSVPYVETGIEDAQIIKYASNAFLATRISFVNEIAAICEQLGADVRNVTEGLGMDPRIGSGYLSPGIGFGGPCLEKDLQALTYSAALAGYHANFLEATLRRNEDQVTLVANRARTLLGDNLSGKRIAVLGLAFKAGTNDVRTSLSVRIIDRLLNLGVSVVGHDPVAIDEARSLLPSIDYADSAYAAAQDADLIMLLTDWPEYAQLDWSRMAAAARGRVVFDGRNTLDPSTCTDAGLDYHGIGRPHILAPR